MENALIKNTAEKLAHRLNFYTQKEGVEFAKMLIGIEILLINVSKLIIIYTLATVLGVWVHTIIVHVSFMLVKRYSFGLHALNSTVCTLVSCLMFVFIPWFLSDIGINNAIALPMFALVIICLYLYAPADTKARPLIGKKLRARFKLKAVLCGLLLMVITLAIPGESIKLLLTLGAAYQTISIMPLTYKILKRSERNYEQHEKRAREQRNGLKGEGVA